MLKDVVAATVTPVGEKVNSCGIIFFYSVPTFLGVNWDRQIEEEQADPGKLNIFLLKPTR